MLTLAYVAGAVRKIYDLRGDPEAAHSEEDKLHQEVLRAIADGGLRGAASLRAASADDSSNRLQAVVRLDR